MQARVNQFDIGMANPFPSPTLPTSPFPFPSPPLFVPISVFFSSPLFLALFFLYPSLPFEVGPLKYS